MARRSPPMGEDQYLLDLAEIRERQAALARLMEREQELDQEESALVQQLKEIRRKRKECRWDQRVLLTGVRRDMTRADEAAGVTPKGEE